MTKKVDRANEGLLLCDRAKQVINEELEKKGFAKWDNECKVTLHLTMKECSVFVEGFACPVMKSFNR
ncbi:hypothetical protein EPI10_000843 [Gossypium australe]|uniref:Uncharacterized protein n=1 Tax=Gossypium australe TaxID=47621 RepID=A0A5B6V933_9ROSI|nr:hypothetical protein EPI10_000843 [Gossypium australe]